MAGTVIDGNKLADELSEHVHEVTVRRTGVRIAVTVDSRN